MRRDRRGLVLAILGVLGLLACAGVYLSLLGAAPAAVGGPFTLADGQGRPRSDAEFRGRYMMIFFGYTGCTDICPQTLTEMSEALDAVDPQATRIQPIFITVDPARDTPERLRRYTAAFSPHLIGLTGTAGQLDAVERRFHVVVEPQRGGSEAVDHSAVIYLLGPDGDFIAPIPADASRVAMQAVLRRYLEPPASAKAEVSVSKGEPLVGFGAKPQLFLVATPATQTRRSTIRAPAAPSRPSPA